MCACNPNRRPVAPYCGRTGCEWPENPPIYTLFGDNNAVERNGVRMSQEEVVEELRRAGAQTTELYAATNKMVAVLGMDGTIYPLHPAVTRVMDALHAIDRGTPVADLIVRDAARYRWLRDRDVDTIDRGGVFAGLTPDNLVINGEDLDAVVDAAMAAAEVAA